MRVLIVNYYEISKLPPVRNLIKVLLENGHVVTLVSLDKMGEYINFKHENFKYCRLNSVEGNILEKGLDFFGRKIKLRKLVREFMKENDVVWTTTDRTVRDIGRILFNYKHIMQLMELIYDMPLFPGQKIFKANLKKYGQHAYKMVVPEYNRAQILNAWWELDKMPEILPNKPAELLVDTVPDNVKSLLDKISNEKRKIILYQGVIREERPLDEFAEAAERLKEDYVLYIMGENNDEMQRLLKKYSNVEHVPFIVPPYHLTITKKAYIGILSYVPRKKDKLHYSKLNEIYCAPNKLYEYGGLGVPMIGNDIPGLKYPLSMYNMGVILENFTTKNIITAIKKVEMNYQIYADNCKRFYDDVNMTEIVNRILS